MYAPATKEKILNALETENRLKKFSNNSPEDNINWDELSKDADWLEKYKAAHGEIDYHQVVSASKLLTKKYPEEQWVIEKVLPLEGITLIVGEAGTMKSYLSLYIAKVLSTQQDFLNHFKVNKTCKILLIDKENKLRRIQKRMKGLNFPTDSEFYLLEYPERFSFEDKTFMEFIKNFILVMEVDVIILDSFIDMFQGNENSSTDTALAFNYIRNLSHTSSFIVLHHDSKPIPKMIRTAAQKTRGSSNIIAQVDTQFYLEKGKDNKSLLIEQGKSRDDEPVPKFLVNIISGVDTGIQDFEYGGEVKDELTKIEESKKLIFDFVATHNLCTKDDLNGHLMDNGLSPRTGKNGLLVLMKEGLVDFTEKPGSGRKHFYFLTDNSEKEEDEIL